jgi:excinuclease ABC subunit A
MTKIDLDFLPSLRTPCEACNGSGYGSQAGQVRLAELTLPELSKLTIAELLTLGETDESFGKAVLRRPLEAARDVGLDYLVLRQPGHTLSGGEAQRLKIARELCRRTTGETLYILDEPSLGQHMEELKRLGALLNRLVNAGNSVVVVEHEANLLASCDWLIELGPGGGPQGGQVIFSGEPRRLAAGHTPTAPFLEAAMTRSRAE